MPARTAFGLDGIAYDGAGSLYVGTLDTGRLFASRPQPPNLPFAVERVQL